MHFQALSALLVSSLVTSVLSAPMNGGQADTTSAAPPQSQAAAPLDQNGLPKYGPNSVCFKYFLEHFPEYQDKYDCKDIEQYKGTYNESYYANLKAEQDKKLKEIQQQDDEYTGHKQQFIALGLDFQAAKDKLEAFGKQYDLEMTAFKAHEAAYMQFKQTEASEAQQECALKDQCEKVFYELKDVFKPKQCQWYDDYKKSYDASQASPSNPSSSPSSSPAPTATSSESTAAPSESTPALSSSSPSSSTEASSPSSSTATEASSPHKIKSE